MKHLELPPLPDGFEYRLDLRQHVTPRALKDQPLHRWFYFPHSFSPQLVDILLDKWKISPGALILDPFVGAGTTLLAARKRGVNALGVDLSPLAIFVSNAKVCRYEPDAIRKGMAHIQDRVSREVAVEISRPERLQRAFNDQEYSVLVRIRQAIMELSSPTRDFLLLALLRTQQQFSRAVPDGGWFRWRDMPSSEHAIWPAFEHIVAHMLSDLPAEPPMDGQWGAIQGDARYLTELQGVYSLLEEGCQAIVTSPPYPNRHDYSRVFQIELLTLGLSERDVSSLRHRSLRSHVEARPPACMPVPFEAPSLLGEVLASLPQRLDRRIRPMLEGYFEDMNAFLKAAYQALVPGGHLALVVGNVRHAGVMVPVDVILVELAKRVGYEPQISWVARLRGNSAQQMGRYGRMPARESVVLLQKPATR